MAYCPNGHGEKNGKFCDECSAELRSQPPGDSLRVRSPEFGTIHQHVYGAGAPQPVSPPSQSNNGLVVLLVALLVVVGGAAIWLALNRTQPGPAADPLAVAVAATLTAQTLPAPSTPPAPDGTATAAFATAQAVAQQPTTSPVASLLDAAATQTLAATATAQPTETPNLDATVQSQVAATLAAQPTATPTDIPAATPDLAAAVAAALAATQTAQQAAQPIATATPNVDATVQSQVAATLAAQPTNTPPPAPSATPNSAATYESAVLATLTAQPTPTRDATATAAVATAQAVGHQPAAASTPLAGETWANPVDGAVYVYVPAGEFVMGREDGPGDEKPAHRVFVNGFWIMRSEVTNIQYQACINARECPVSINPRTYESAYANHPVAGISWAAANAYANWVGGKLPTESEWEKSCRGTDERAWPWGNNTPDAGRANYGNYEIGTRAVGLYTVWTSPYGAMNLAGNVTEWTADWYAANYYGQSPARNPLGPEEGTMRVLRGGSFGNSTNSIRCTTRNRNLPTTRLNTIGFRVVVTRP